MGSATHDRDTLMHFKLAVGDGFLVSHLRTCPCVSHAGGDLRSSVMYPEVRF